MNKDIYKRLALVEAMTNAQKSELLETLSTAYKNACEGNDEAQAAYYVRAIRNKLLESSDKEMSLDRLGLDSSSATKFIVSLSAILNGRWAKYRQALRDIPNGDGFPFNVVFPPAPDSVEEDENL